MYYIKLNFDGIGIKAAVVNNWGEAVQVAAKYARYSVSTARKYLNGRVEGYCNDGGDDGIVMPHKIHENAGIWVRRVS